MDTEEGGSGNVGRQGRRAGIETLVLTLTGRQGKREVESRPQY
jgi:hypothetical protein